MYADNRYSFGFTLTELMMYIIISMGAFHIAIPSFTHLISSAQLGSITTKFLSHYALAKTVAMQRNTNIHLCVSEGLECIKSDQWHRGWILFEDYNQNNQAEEDEIIRIAPPLPNGYTLFPNKNTDHLVFSPNGLITKLNGSLPLMTFRMCSQKAKPENMNRYAREMVINGAGRVRLQYGRNHVTECE